MEITRYSIHPKTKKYIKGCRFLLFVRNLFDKYGEKVLNTATKTRLEVLKTASKKEVHKTADATGEFMGMKTADKIVKPKLVPNDN